MILSPRLKAGRHFYEGVIMNDKKSVLSRNAPQPRGPYSQAVIHNNILYISGQGPIDPVTNEVVNGTVEQETLRVLENIKAIASEAGAALGNILKMTCYLADINDFASFNSAYKNYFIKEPPARTTIQAGGLPASMKIVIDAVVAL